eukprot:CAMPEP_0171086836 /NCGR_PEP_ID=MMETSP0766_2-20121228/19786_1 /TAXON_ID=439317 /ORGANISM="Gambierdiscus australes, Strain CAWD 149" /LENGTH=442 /DNA_ID=CAMNT_0011544505 /DNA_START=127 /DNA_END=1455 /DNA_ORIENTATION=-
MSDALAGGVGCNRWLWIGMGLALFVSLCGLCCLCGYYSDFIISRCQKAAGIDDGGCSIPEFSEVASEGVAEAAPLVLRVVSPSNQVGCTGEYELTLTAGGEYDLKHPVWKKKGGDRWIYSGDDGRWYIGGVACSHLHFHCAGGFIFHPSEHRGILPHRMVGHWEWGGGVSWHTDPSISVTSVPDYGEVVHPLPPRLPPSPIGSRTFSMVEDPLAVCSKLGKKDSSEVSTDDGGTTTGSTARGDSSEASSTFNYDEMLPAPVAARPQTTPWRSPGRLVRTTRGFLPERSGPLKDVKDGPTLLTVTSPNGQQECEGEYVLADDMQPNGQPVWRQQNGEHWLYSSTTARWCIGGMDVKHDNFARSAGWVCQTAPHGGLMPDKALAGWMRWENGQFMMDDGISVVAVVPAPICSDPYLPRPASRGHSRFSEEIFGVDYHGMESCAV